ncbi:MerR family transcriptional regulator [Laspinema palackyanum]|uniref:MerR family transcriptional regulator n=1 Tax=Laspinema palackyanum TaxID=3231601 RepID=UPI00349F562C
MEYDLVQTQSITGYTSKQIQAFLKISDRRLRHYCKLLRVSCPDEFEHPTGSGFYSPESYRAIKKVRSLFKLGATESQVINTLKLEGF